MDITCKKEDLENSFDLIYQTEGDIYFLLIGIDNYLYEKQLNFASKQALSFFKTFGSALNTKRNNVYTLFNENATKINIVNQFDYFYNHLRKNDRLIIYLAGHCFQNEFNNFFIPYDGEKSNSPSCIANDWIFDSLKLYHNDVTCLFTDLNVIDKKSITEYNSVSTWELTNHINIKGQFKKLFISKCIDFISTPLSGHVRENYCFVKTKPTNRKLKVDNLKDKAKTLNVFLEGYHLTIKKSLEEENIESTLKRLRDVVRNNDKKLLSIIDTLLFKLENLKETFTANLITPEELVAELEFIQEETRRIAQIVNENGFYIIKVPEDRIKNLKTKANKTKILFTSANPIDTEPLRLNKEMREIEYQLLKSKERDSFELIKVQSTRIEDLQDALLNHEPQFVHFCGHGNCNGIALLDDDDNCQLVESKPLAGLFELFSDKVVCVFLNSCHSKSQSEEISKYIKKVICMGKSVPDNLAIKFATSFYKSIGAGQNIDFSFKFAKNSLELYSIKESDIPVLLPSTLIN